MPLERNRLGDVAHHHFDNLSTQPDGARRSARAQTCGAQALDRRLACEACGTQQQHGRVGWQWNRRNSLSGHALVVFVHWPAEAPIDDLLAHGKRMASRVRGGQRVFGMGCLAAGTAVASSPSNTAPTSRAPWMVRLSRRIWLRQATFGEHKRAPQYNYLCLFLRSVGRLTHQHRERQPTDPR